MTPAEAARQLSYAQQLVAHVREGVGKPLHMPWLPKRLGEVETDLELLRVFCQHRGANAPNE